MGNNTQIKDVPRFNLINVYEDRFKADYQKNLGVMIARIASTLKSYLPKNSGAKDELIKASDQEAGRIHGMGGRYQKKTKDEKNIVDFINNERKTNFAGFIDYLLHLPKYQKKLENQNHLNKILKIKDSAKNVNSGYCGQFADYLILNVGGEKCGNNRFHNWVYKDGLAFDSVHPNGTNDVMEISKYHGSKFLKENNVNIWDFSYIDKYGNWKKEDRRKKEEDTIQKAIETVKYAIGVVLNKKGQVLLGKSLQKDFRLGKYCFPGGTIEENDGIYETVEREVQEETGLIVESDNGRILVDGKCIFSVCKVISGKIEPNDEFESLDWYDISDLPKDTLKQNRIVLRKILNRDQLEKAWNSEFEKGLSDNEAGRIHGKAGRYQKKVQNDARDLKKIIESLPDKKHKTGLKDVDINSVFKNKFSEKIRNAAKKVSDDFYKRKAKFKDFKGFIYEKGRIESVDVADLYPFQDGLDRNGLLESIKPDNNHKSSVEPYAVIADGKIVLVEGHHRVAKDILEGKETIRIRVYHRGDEYDNTIEKASKHGEGKHTEEILVHKNGKTFLREQIVGSEKKEEWWSKFKQYKLSRYPIGIPESEVQTNTEGDVHSHWVMMWKDTKSKRVIRAYSHEFLERNAQVKWERIKNVSSDKIDTIKAKALTLLQNGTDKEKQCAAVVFIIASTGLRPGDKSRMADTGNRGVSTLGPDNVLINGKDIKLNFIGKSYKVNNAHIVNKELSDYLQERIETTEGKNTIFNLSKKDLMDTFRAKIGGSGLKLKDMRTYVATDMARKILFEDTLPPPPVPENNKDLKKEIITKLNVCYDKVSKQLNNTPAMAKNSYIHPAVVDAYLKSVGVTRDQIMKADKENPTLDEIIANSDYKGKIWDIEETDDDLDNLFNEIIL